MSDPVMGRIKRWMYRMQVFRRLVPVVLLLSGLYWFRDRWQKPSAESGTESVPHNSAESAESAELFTLQLAQPGLASRQPSQSGTVVAVPNADALTVWSGGKQLQLRLCGIDAPELTQPGGKQAQAFLKHLLEQGQQVEFIPVRQQSSYLIAEVFVSAAGNSSTAPLFVNQELVQSGSAYVYQPYVQECPHQQALVEAETLARPQLGHIETHSSRPWEYRRQQVAQQLFQPSNTAQALAKIRPDYLRDGMQRTLIGIASWYGPMLHGKPTASGETFDQNKLTAAHSSLPFDTRLQITNLQNGKTVIVRINDYHPALDNSTIDISQAAAQQLDAIDAGVVPVEMEILEGR
jgi:rare lipoprotein A (peptidoglycan hydrolase)